MTSCLQSWTEPFPHVAIRCQSPKSRRNRPSTFAIRCHCLPQVLVPCLFPRQRHRRHRVKTTCSRLPESTGRAGVSRHPDGGEQRRARTSSPRPRLASSQEPNDPTRHRRARAEQRHRDHRSRAPASARAAQRRRVLVNEGASVPVARGHVAAAGLVSDQRRRSRSRRKGWPAGAHAARSPGHEQTVTSVAGHRWQRAGLAFAADYGLPGAKKQLRPDRMSRPPSPLASTHRVKVRVPHIRSGS